MLVYISVNINEVFNKRQLHKTKNPLASIFLLVKLTNNDE